MELQKNTSTDEKDFWKFYTDQIADSSLQKVYMAYLFVYQS